MPENWQLVAARDLHVGDLIEDPTNQAAWRVEAVAPASRSGNFYMVRAGAFWLDWTPASREFMTLRREDMP
jgi:hypothetical protein